MINMRLELLARKHFDKIVEWRNNPRIYNAFFTRKKATLSGQEEWFMDSIRDSEKNFVLCAEIIDSDNVAPSMVGTDYIGFGSLYNISNGTAEFGRFYIGEDRYLGCGFQALSLILDYGFSNVKLEQIYLYSMSNNTRAIKLYKRAGFVECEQLTINGVSAVKMLLSRGRYGNNKSI